MSEMEEEMSEIVQLQKKVTDKFPNLQMKNNSTILESKISKIVNDTVKNFEGEIDTNNCNGIYQACIGVAATSGAVCVVATSGVGAYFCVLAAGAGMELCRQQRLGCH